MKVKMAEQQATRSPNICLLSCTLEHQSGSKEPQTYREQVHGTSYIIAVVSVG